MGSRELEREFKKYPDRKCVIIVNIYGMPDKLHGLRAICDSQNTVMIKDEAESLFAAYKCQQTGTLGKHNVISLLRAGRTSTYSS